MVKRNQLVLAAMLSLVLAGCGGDKGVKGEEGAGGAGGEGGVTASGLSDDGGASGSLLGADMEQLLSTNKVYFEFDSAAVDEESRRVIEAHSQFLIENPDVNVVLEGHTDERGTREYNLALGERRANAVAEIMVAYGVAAGRIQTISYGEERPAAMGSDESAWQLNRRVVILR
ncbi:MAG TPA: peptidoglycan-associated lipoprotein Pal [Arenicellales bacterium]|nr:peptidoglycan-associated lipoprotein Pal [Arenicellales bacterium]